MHALELTYPKDSFPRGFVTKMIKSNHGKVAIHRHRRNTKAVLAVFERAGRDPVWPAGGAPALYPALPPCQICPPGGIHLHRGGRRGEPRAGEYQGNRRAGPGQRRHDTRQDGKRRPLLWRQLSNPDCVLPDRAAAEACTILRDHKYLIGYCESSPLGIAQASRPLKQPPFLRLAARIGIHHRRAPQ